MLDYEKVDVQNGPVKLAARIYRSALSSPGPVVILCHGFCGIQDILLPPFARAFAKAGFNAITFDYQGFGDSNGERGRLIPSRQVLDILTMAQWAKTQSAFDPTRIGLWGTSLGGCNVISAASVDSSIKCVISQLPFADGESLITDKMSPEEKKQFLESLDKMHEKKCASGKELFVPIPKIMSDEESSAFFQKARAEFPQTDVKIPYLTVREMVRYKLETAAARITQPTLVIAAEFDRVNPPEQAYQLYQAIPSLKSYFLVGDARHYDVYSGEPFEQVIEQQLTWLRKHL